MEFKHFSHNHGLVFNQLPQGFHCSGCKSPGSGNVYVCWQCSYFLHEQCFRASRSLKHPSHPLHPLTLMPSPTYQSGSFLCNSCNLDGYGFSYSCSECDFDIHVHCAVMPNVTPRVSLSPTPAQNFNSQPQNSVYPPIKTGAFPTYPPRDFTIPNDTQNYSTSLVNAPATNPSPPPQPQSQPNATVPTYSTVDNKTTTTAALPAQRSFSQPSPVQNKNPHSKSPTTIKHFSHPHALKQKKINQKNANVCSACESEISDSAYCCIESDCTFDLHKSCFDLPREIQHKSHRQHPLTLVAAPPYRDGTFTCNACLQDGEAFAYTCVICSYDLHIDCIQLSETVTRPDHEHSLTLYYSSPYAEESEEVTFMCDVCNKLADEKEWVYYCRECDFGTHLECVHSEIKQQSGNTEDIEKQLLRFQIEMAQQIRRNRKAMLDNI